MKPEPKNHYVLLISEHENVTESVVSAGFIMAELFMANIVRVHVHFSGEKALPPTSITEEKGFRLHHHHIHRAELLSVFAIAEENNAIMGIIAVDKAKPKLNAARRVLKLVRKSRIPFLVVQSRATDLTQLKKIVLPVDFLQQTKEKALWASYFSRYYGSIIHAISTPYKDEFYRQHSKNNLKFIERMYNNLEVEYEKVEIAGANHKLDRAAIEFAAANSAGLVVIMTTLDYNIDDLIWGPPELRLIQNPEQVPVLCLNQRNDIYVLCS